MTRENKLSLVIGFGLMLFVGILVSDHFAAQRYDPVSVSQSDPVAPEESVQLEAVGLEQLAAAEPVVPAGPVDLAAGGTSALPDAVAVASRPAADSTAPGRSERPVIPRRAAPMASTLFCSSAAWRPRNAWSSGFFAES